VLVVPLQGTRGDAGGDDHAPPPLRQDALISTTKVCYHISLDRTDLLIVEYFHLRIDILVA
jgi:hypothetical protein